MERLTEEQLKNLYIEYVKYRDSVAHQSKPSSVSDFYVSNKIKFNNFRSKNNETK